MGPDSPCIDDLVAPPTRGSTVASVLWMVPGRIQCESASGSSQASNSTSAEAAIVRRTTTAAEARSVHLRFICVSVLLVE